VSKLKDKRGSAYQIPLEIDSSAVIPAHAGIQTIFPYRLKRNLDAGFHRHDELSRRLKVVTSRWSEEFRPRRIETLSHGSL
jgi:hypothetical protein